MPRLPVATRISESELREIEALAKEEKVDKATLLRRVIDLGLRQLRTQRTVELYRAGRVTMRKAARIAGVSLWEMIDVLDRERVPVQYSLKDLREDLEEAYG